MTAPRLITFDIFGTVVDWRAMSERRGGAFGPDGWHVSAHADDDFAVANALGLTTVLVERPHSRAGAATHSLSSLAGLRELLEV